MPKNVFITADSTCDLSEELLERFQIQVIPLTIDLGGEVFLDGAHFTPEEMYRRYRSDGVLPKTSAPSPQEFTDFFQPLLDRGGEVVHLSISAELSNAFNAARLVAGELKGVYVIDSRMLSTGIGLLAIEGAECRDRGMSAAEIARHLEALKEQVDTSFVLDTLEFMRKGGRCSNMAALGANLLKLKPALEMRDGKLQVYKKYRGNMEQVYRQYVRERLEGKHIRPGHLFVLNSGEIAPEVLEELYALARVYAPDCEIHHNYAGCTVSSHCGPRTLGVFFLKE